MRKMKSLLFGALFFLIFQPCFGKMAQEIIVPGYPPTTSSSTPVSSVKSAAITTTTLPGVATDARLQQLIQSVDLTNWAGISTRLWTCTPRYFTVPMFDAKNAIERQFNQIKKKKKNLTEAQAAAIARTLSEPIGFKIPGLSGIMCRVNLYVANVEKPYSLTCMFIMLDARSLSRLFYTVSENNGKPEVVSEDVINAIQKLLDANCSKQDL